MKEMVDNVARAICTRRNIYGDDCIARNEAGTVICGCGRREAFEADARAAIAAMREPTAAMIAAGDELCPVARGTESHKISGAIAPEDYWRAMNDAALAS